MRIFISYLFLAAIVLNSFSRLFIHVDFLVNQDYIAENLCENKDKPIMQCNGSCQLQMELEKDDERKETSAKHQVEIIPTLVAQEVFEFQNTAPICLLEKPHFYTLQSNTVGFVSPIFHPPTA